MEVAGALPGRPAPAARGELAPARADTDPGNPDLPGAQHPQFCREFRIGLSLPHTPTPRGTYISSPLSEKDLTPDLRGRAEPPVANKDPHGQAPSEQRKLFHVSRNSRLSPRHPSLKVPLSSTVSFLRSKRVRNLPSRKTGEERRKLASVGFLVWGIFLLLYFPFSVLLPTPRSRSEVLYVRLCKFLGGLAKV